MKQVLTKEMVKKAMDELKATGKNVTLVKLHAALENRGSMSTLVAIKAELDADSQPASDSADGLKTFREVWALAREEGRKQQDSAIADLKADFAALAQENERLEGLATAAANQADESNKTKAAIEVELANLKSLLANAQQSLIQAGADARVALERLAGTQQELATAVQKAHVFELELVQCRTRLEGQNDRTKH